MYSDPNGLLSGDYITALGLRGCCALKFLHTLEIDQGLLLDSAHPKEDGVSKKILIVKI